MHLDQSSRILVLFTTQIRIRFSERSPTNYLILIFFNLANLLMYIHCIAFAKNKKKPQILSCFGKLSVRCL